MVKSKGTGMTKTRRRATRVGAEGLLKQGWSLTFYWCLKGPGHCHHHVGAKYPEDIVDEEAAQQDAARADVVQVQELHPVKGEGQAKEVVGNPVLGEGGSETGSLCPRPCPFWCSLCPSPPHSRSWLLTFLSRYQTPTTLLRPRHTRSLVSNS